jgi:hypothetical protein
MPQYFETKKTKPPKVAEQPFAPIPSLPGEFGKKVEAKKKGKKTGGFGVK